MVQRMTNDSQAQPNSTVGDTSEQQVLGEAARSLQELADRLPADSRWREVFTGVAEGFEAGAAINQRREARRAA